MATRSADTVLNILQAISDMRGESSTDSSANRIRAITRAEQTFSLRRFWKVHLNRNVQLTGDGTGDYTIGSSNYPMRQKGLTEVFVGGLTEDKRYQVIDYFQYLKLYNNNNADRIAYEYYDQANDVWKVHINPVVSIGTDIYYSYFYQPPKRTATNETVVCPNMDAIIYYAKGYIDEFEDEPELAAEAFQKAEQILSELEGIEESPAINQIYQMGAIENSITNRGLGSY